MGIEIRVYYEDTDAGGVVYHANYLGFLERSRTEFLRERGVSVKELADQGSIFPVIRMEIDYRSPAVLDDLLRVTTELVKLGKTSFTVRQRVVRGCDGQLLVEALVTLVCASAAMRAKRLPALLVQALQAEQPVL